MAVPPDFWLTVSSDNGSVPPEYRRDWRITIDATGEGSRESSREYGKADLRTDSFLLGKQDLERLVADLDALGLFSTEWVPSERPTVGGPSTWLEYTADGESTKVPVSLERDQRAVRRAIVERIEALVRIA